MKRKTGNLSKTEKSAVSLHAVTQRLDESLPLNTDAWERVEQLLMQMTEFAPTRLVLETVNAIAVYADDQAQRGYVLGQEDLIADIKNRAA
ncbi:MAG TPA: hypothetical protein V6D17_23150 [Candidatus Obscuribacterales bacterium]